MVIVLHTIYAEIDDNVTGGYSTFNHISDILISFPSAQAYYHSDHNGQTLWQVHGSKRVYVYRNKPPFLTKKMLEYSALYSDETSVTYDPSYDQSASIYELKAVQMLHWLLFSPHRVETWNPVSLPPIIPLATDFAFFPQFFRGADCIGVHQHVIFSGQNLDQLGHRLNCGSSGNL
jgi:hypothetical protein